MPRTAPTTSIFHQFNCGYARCAVKELTAQLAAGKRGNAAREVNRDLRAERFRTLFSDPLFGIPEGFFINHPSKTTSLFDDRCEAILNAFAMKWKSSCKRHDYLMTLTTQKWRKLTAQERTRHTLENCMACAIQHAQLQECFPGPTFKPDLESMYSEASTNKQEEKKMTRQALRYVNSFHEEKFGHSVTASATALCPELHLQKKPSQSEVLATKRKRDRRIRDNESTVLAAIVPRQILGDSTASVSSYMKRRKQYYLERPKQCGKAKSHSPSENNCTWDVSTAMDLLRAWPAETRINWSAEAEKLGIPSANRGQVLKETAKRLGIDTMSLDGRSGRRIRARKRRLPGSAISVGCAPSKKALQNTWAEMVESGELNLGEPCAPYTITRVRQGTQQVQELIDGRKVPLLDIRKQALKDHFPFMRLQSRAQVITAGRAQLERLVGQGSRQMSDSELHQYVTDHMAHRHFAVWHDHSTLCGYGFIMVTCKEIYDRVVHYTDEEYKALTGESVHVQAQVERPYLHLLAAGSSCTKDHTALTADRLDCVKTFGTTIRALDGTLVTDTLRFFNGDKVSQWVEGGCQAGGHYKCSSCRVHSTSFSDSAYCNQIPYKSLADNQAHILAGIYGGKRNSVTPFKCLSIQEVRQELAVRRLDSSGDSKVCRERLAEHLGGLQRVSLLLLSNPSEDLKVLHLEHYSLNDFEPLHAIKGHLINLFAELPRILPHTIQGDFNQLLAACLRKEKVTGADLRATAITLCQFLTGKVCTEVQALLESIVRVAQISYLSDQQRTPRAVLQMYNCAWYHHELLQYLIPHPTVISRQKLFGSYLHDISRHAPPQFETVSLRSCNTEFEERLFGQARQVAENCTNRQPQNVLQQMFIRLQVLLTQGKVKVKESKVARAAKGLAEYRGTVIPKEFVKSRMHSWLVHLQRISPFLSKGEGVWWVQTSTAYCFMDGGQHPDEQAAGPQLFHYRTTSQKQLETTKTVQWEAILRSGTKLPTPYIQHYSAEGFPTHKTLFPDDATTHPPTANVPQAPTADLTVSTLPMTTPSLSLACFATPGTSSASFATPAPSSASFATPTPSSASFATPSTSSASFVTPGTSSASFATPGTSSASFAPLGPSSASFATPGTSSASLATPVPSSASFATPAPSSASFATPGPSSASFATLGPSSASFVTPFGSCTPLPKGNPTRSLAATINPSTPSIPLATGTPTMPEHSSRISVTDTSEESGSDSEDLVLYKEQQDPTSLALCSNDISTHDDDSEIVPELEYANESVPPHSPEELQSSYSRTMRSIIGTSKDLIMYDELLTSLKKGGTRNQPQHRKMHDKLLASLQTKVLAAYNSLVKQQNDLEKKSMERSGTLPLSAQYKEHLRRLKRCKALLRMWNITL